MELIEPFEPNHRFKPHHSGKNRNPPRYYQSAYKILARNHPKTLAFTRVRNPRLFVHQFHVFRQPGHILEHFLMKLPKYIGILGLVRQILPRDNLVNQDGLFSTGTSGDDLYLTPHEFLYPPHVGKGIGRQMGHIGGAGGGLVPTRMLFIHWLAAFQ